MKTLVLIVSIFLLSTDGNKDLGTDILAHAEHGGSCDKATDLKCPRNDITFWLYTKSNQKGIKLDAGSLGKAPWSKGPLKFLVHGYSVNKDTAINQVLRPAYFSHGEYNIISVDWSALGKSGCYAQAIENVPTVAKCVADFFNAVVKAHKFPSVHLLGHSMGAHIAAAASEDIPNLPRLTKFDPASPLFTSKNSKKGKAHFIDVYHSNAGIKGQKEASGDVDVYFNNGAFQPGCACDTSCSHLRCVQYFAESIGATLKAFPCGGWSAYEASKCHVPTLRDLVAVGDNIQAKKGTYMVFTNSKSPYILKDTSYTDKTSFFGFRKSVGAVCGITDIKKLIEKL